MRPALPCSQRGFTLIELVMSIVLMGVLATFGVSMVYDNMTTVLSVNAGARSLDRARYAMERLSRELREVKFTTTGTYNITSALAAGATSITFVRNVNGSDVTITISRSGSNVNVQYASVQAVLVDGLLDVPGVPGVPGFRLDFYDVDGATTTSTADLRFIGVTLVVKDSTSGQSVSQRMRVALRNG